MIPTTILWTAIGCRVPGVLLRAFKKRLIDDHVPYSAFLVSVMHAYVSGQLLCKHEGNCRGTNVQFTRRGDVTEFHVQFKTADGRLINPILISEDYFLE